MVVVGLTPGWDSGTMAAMADATMHHGLIEALPAWVIWRQRSFPNANLLLLTGGTPALVDSGFVGHAEQTAEWVHGRGGAELVVNTHWHSDHVGGNARLQADGAAVAASVPDAQAVARRDPGCCLAEYLDQPVAPYDVDEELHEGQVLRLGEADWQVVATPGHTPGHLALWQPEERILVVGDALSDYDVGWVCTALDGQEATDTALASVQRMVDLDPRVLLPAHGPVSVDTGAALAKAVQRAQRLVDDPAGAVWYGVRRVFAFALMIRGGLATGEVESYLLERVWLQDAAGQLGLAPETLVEELVTGMTRSGAVVVSDGRVRAAAEHTPVEPAALQVPFPRDWPDAPNAG